MIKQHTTLATAIGFALALSSGAALAGADETVVQLIAGVEYASGKYGGTEAIEDLYVPVSVAIDSGRFGMSLTIPYLSVTGPSGTTTDTTGQTTPGTGETSTESGLGDIVGRLTVYDVLYDRDRGLALDVTGTAKLGTADADKGLGTGENDYTLWAEGYKFFDRATAYTAVGYRFRGEPAGVDLNDVLVASVGAVWGAGVDSQLGVSFDFRESAAQGFDDIHEATAFASFRLNENWFANTYVFSGFTDSSPDWGAGISVSTDFQRFRGRPDY
jgi:hypothetical protein